MDAEGEFDVAASAVRLCCECLNFLIELLPEGKVDGPQLELLQAIGFPVGLVGLKRQVCITIPQVASVRHVQRGPASYQVYRCCNCELDCMALDPTAQVAVVSARFMPESAAALLRERPDYSAQFGVVVPFVGGSAAGVPAAEEAHSSFFELVEEAVGTARLAAERRIVEYAREQREAVSQLEESLRRHAALLTLAGNRVGSLGDVSLVGFQGPAASSLALLDSPRSSPVPPLSPPFGLGSQAAAPARLSSRAVQGTAAQMAGAAASAAAAAAAVGRPLRRRASLPGRSFRWSTASADSGVDGEGAAGGVPAVGGSEANRRTAGEGSGSGSGSGARTAAGGDTASTDAAAAGQTVLQPSGTANDVKGVAGAATAAAVGDGSRVAADSGSGVVDGAAPHLRYSGGRGAPGSAPAVESGAADGRSSAVSQVALADSDESADESGSDDNGSEVFAFEEELETRPKRHLPTVVRVVRDQVGRSGAPGDVSTAAARQHALPRQQLGAQREAQAAEFRNVPCSLPMDVPLPVRGGSRQGPASPAAGGSTSTTRGRARAETDGRPSAAAAAAAAATAAAQSKSGATGQTSERPEAGRERRWSQLPPPPALADAGSLSPSPNELDDPGYWARGPDGGVPSSSHVYAFTPLQ